MTERPTHPTAAVIGALALVALALVAVAGRGATPAAAQARPVTALIHTFPDRPEPGDDVVVRVDVTGCPPGPVTVEIHLATDDGATRRSTLMGRSAARTNLLGRTHGIVPLTGALRGWYGARVLCGSFRPPREPMTNTLFAVGPTPPPAATVDTTTVARGSSVAYQGAGCVGTIVEYALTSGHRSAGAFDPSGFTAVNPDGTWRAEVAIPLDVPAGPMTLRARCVAANLLGEPAHVYEPRAVILQVT